MVDAFYFAALHADRRRASPTRDLTLTHGALKLFTVFYVLTGIEILVELARELGIGFVRERGATHAGRHKEDPPETQSAG